MPCPPKDSTSVVSGIPGAVQSEPFDIPGTLRSTTEARLRPIRAFVQSAPSSDPRLRPIVVPCGTSDTSSWQAGRGHPRVSDEGMPSLHRPCLRPAKPTTFQRFGAGRRRSRDLRTFSPGRSSRDVLPGTFFPGRSPRDVVPGTFTPGRSPRDVLPGTARLAPVQNASR